MDAIGKQDNAAAMRQDSINRFEQLAGIVGPRGIRGVDVEAEGQRDAIGGQPNLHHTIITLMAGLIHRQVQHLVW